MLNSKEPVYLTIYSGEENEETEDGRYKKYLNILNSNPSHMVEKIKTSNSVIKVNNTHTQPLSLKPHIGILLTEPNEREKSSQKAERTEKKFSENIEKSKKIDKKFAEKLDKTDKVLPDKINNKDKIETTGKAEKSEKVAEFAVKTENYNEKAEKAEKVEKAEKTEKASITTLKSSMSKTKLGNFSSSYGKSPTTNKNLITKPSTALLKSANMNLAKKLNDKVDKLTPSNKDQLNSFSKDFKKLNTNVKIMLDNIFVKQAEATPTNFSAKKTAK